MSKPFQCVECGSSHVRHPVTGKTTQVFDAGDAAPLSKYAIDERTRADLDNRFSYHAPFGDQVARYGQVRAAFKELAELVCASVPPGRERALALTKLQEANMWSNAGIACGEVENGGTEPHFLVGKPSLKSALASSDISLEWVEIEE